jgi:hypothetical protein
MSNITFSKSRIVEHSGMKIEKNCCVTFQEKQFCALGASISKDRIFAYISRNKVDNSFNITTWEGQILSNEVRILNKAFNPFDVYGMNEGFYLRFTYKGKVYSGVSPDGCYVKARVSKLKHLWGNKN